MKHAPSLHLQGRSIRCLLFDLGETLWVHQDQATMEHITTLNERTCAALLQTYVSELPSFISDYLQWSIKLRQAIAKRYQSQRTHQYEIEPDPLIVTASACQDVSLPLFETQQLVCLFEAFRPPLAQARRLLDGVLPVLDKLKAQGIILGCVTDRQYGGERFREDLRQLELLDYFAPEAIIVSADYGKRKPHSSLFLKAMAALHVSAAETAMVGDFLSRDIAGAKQLQMGAIWKPKERLLQQALTIIPEKRQEVLFRLACQEEEAMYPEIPFAIIEKFLQPDCTIEHVTELLSLLL